MLRSIAVVIGAVCIAVAMAGCGSDEPLDVSGLVATGAASAWSGLNAEEKDEVATRWVAVAAKKDKRAPEAVVLMADVSTPAVDEQLRDFFMRVVRNPPALETDVPEVLLAQPPSAWEGLGGDLKTRVARAHIAADSTASAEKTPTEVVSAADNVFVNALGEIPTVDRYLFEAFVVAQRTKCEGTVGPLVTSLESLGSRLSVGLNYEAYSEKTGDLRVDYDRIEFSSLGPKCLKAAAAAESAMNAYIRAYNTWNDCFSDFDCSNDSIRSKLQGEWARADTLAARARKAIG